MIKNSLIEEFPTWYKDIDPDKHYLVMTNDFDSYYSCKYLNKRFKLKVGGYYEFESGLWLNAERTEGKQPIYVDLSISEGMTFDNHFTFIKNPLAINPNVGTSVYNRKYNGSTLALIYALYDRDLDELDENALTALLCIDSWHYGYYNKGGTYRDINLRWYDALGMSENLLPILEQHDMSYFTDFISRFNLKESIRIKNGYLHWDVTPPLPVCQFELVQSVKKQFTSKLLAQSIYNKEPNSILVSAETYKDEYVINLRRNDND